VHSAEPKIGEKEKKIEPSNSHTAPHIIVTSPRQETVIADPKIEFTDSSWCENSRTKMPCKKD